MAQALPRFVDTRVEDERRLAQILLETGLALPDASTAKTISCVTHGDPERLRGLPAIGRGVRSVSPGTDPVRALLAKERRQGR